MFFDEQLAVEFCLITIPSYFTFSNPHIPLKAIMAYHIEGHFPHDTLPTQSELREIMNR